jgi:hypothetical protein
VAERRDPEDARAACRRLSMPSPRAQALLESQPPLSQPHYRNGALRWGDKPLTRAFWGRRLFSNRRRTRPPLVSSSSRYSPVRLSVCAGVQEDAVSGRGLTRAGRCTLAPIADQLVAILKAGHAATDLANAIDAHGGRDGRLAHDFRMAVVAACGGLIEPAVGYLGVDACLAAQGRVALTVREARVANGHDALIRRVAPRGRLLQGARSAGSAPTPVLGLVEPDAVPDLRLLVLAGLLARPTVVVLQVRHPYGERASANDDHEQTRRSYCNKQSRPSWHATLESRSPRELSTLCVIARARTCRAGRRILRTPRRTAHAHARLETPGRRRPSPPP